MTPQEQRIAAATLDYLLRSLKGGSTFFADARDRPQVGTAMEALLADKDLMEPILLAGMYLEVARDHYGAVLWAFVPPAEVPKYAPYTLVRGALEANAWACWLLDTSLTPAERLARSLTVRALNIREVRRLDLADDHPDYYGKRIGQVKAVAARHQLPELTNKEGDLFAVGGRRPEMVALLDQLLPDQNVGPNAQPLGSRTYGLLSARAHGNPWAVLHNVKRAEQIGPHSAAAEVELDVVEFMRLLRVAIRLHSEAMCRIAILNGQDPADWEKLRGPTAESKLGQ